MYFSMTVELHDGPGALELIPRALRRHFRSVISTGRPLHSPPTLRQIFQSLLHLQFNSGLLPIEEPLGSWTSRKLQYADRAHQKIFVDAATRTTLKRFEEAGQPEDNIIDLIVAEYEIPLQFVDGSDSIVSATAPCLRRLSIMPWRRFDTNTALERCRIVDHGTMIGCE